MKGERFQVWRRAAGGVILLSGFSGCLSDDNLNRPTSAPAASFQTVPSSPASTSKSGPQSVIPASPGLTLQSPGSSAPRNRTFDDSTLATNIEVVPKNSPTSSNRELKPATNDAHSPIVAAQFAPHESDKSDADIVKPAPPVIPTANSDYPIDLASALRLAGDSNPTIAIAQEAVHAAREEQLRARALLLPSVSGGLSYHWHDGTLQSASGTIRDLDSQFFYAGAGDMFGSSFVIPGIYLYANLSDAIYAPLAARQRVTGLAFTAQATRNTVLLNVAERYFALAAAEENLKALVKSGQEFGEIARLTANFAQAGQGRESDAQRARAEALLQHDKANQAEEMIAVASADLVQLLSLDAAVRLHAAGDGLAPVTLVDPNADLDSLLQTARGNRPEVAAAAAAIEEARTRMRQEKVRPFLPLVSLGVSSGTFGGGSSLAGYPLSHFNDRMDFDVTTVWTLQNLAVGNVARARTNSAILGQAIAEQQRVLDQVAREVAEARALVLDRRLEVDTTARQLRSAEHSYQFDLTRAKNIQGLPIELLNSARLMEQARQDFIRAIVGYNQAQLRLHVALGRPPIAEPAPYPAAPQ